MRGDMRSHLKRLQGLTVTDGEYLIDGGSASIGPDGANLAGPVYHEETILYGGC